MGKLIGVPELPTHFLQRPNDLKAIKTAVLAGLNKAVGVTQSLGTLEGQAAGPLSSWLRKHTLTTR